LIMINGYSQSSFMRMISLSSLFSPQRRLH
jgi:hypothetical protein